MARARPKKPAPTQSALSAYLGGELAHDERYILNLFKPWNRRVVAIDRDDWRVLGRFMASKGVFAMVEETPEKTFFVLSDEATAYIHRNPRVLQVYNRD